MFDSKQIASNVIEISEDYGGVTPLKLQKILYILSGFYQVNTKEKLFKENFKAWRHGPVLEDVYQSYKSYKSSLISEPEMNIRVNHNIERYIKEILLNTKNIDAKILSEMTHVEPPWLLNYNGNSLPISQNLVTEYFNLFESVTEYLDVGFKRLSLRELEKERRDYFLNLEDLENEWMGPTTQKPSIEIISKFKLLLNQLVMRILSKNIKIFPEIIMGPIPKGGFSMEFRYENDIFIVRKLNSGEYAIEVMQGTFYSEFEIHSCKPDEIFNKFLMKEF